MRVHNTFDAKRLSLDATPRPPDSHIQLRATHHVDQSIMHP